MNEFGEWLSKELDRIPWSQRELARQAGVTQTTIARIISGETSPQLKTLAGIAHAFGQSMEELLRRAGVLPAVGELPEGWYEMGARLMALSPDQRAVVLQGLENFLKLAEPQPASRRGRA